MRARHAIHHGLILCMILLVAPQWAKADEQKLAPSMPAKAPNAAAPDATKPTGSPPAPVGTLPPLPVSDGDPKSSPAVAAALLIAPANSAEVKRAEAGIAVREEALKKSGEIDNPANKPIREVLTRRKQLLGNWTEAARRRDEFEHPTPSPDQVAAELKADQEKTRGMLDQASKAPDGLLPEAFGPTSRGGSKPTEVRLAEMKEAIDTARLELKDRGGEIETLRADEAKNHGGDLAAIRVNRDKIHQSASALATGRAQLEAAVANAATAEARELAKDRLINHEWECRVEAERLAEAEAQISLTTKRADLNAMRIQTKASHQELDRKLLEIMEKRYAAQSERQQRDLQQAVAKEETRAAHTDDILERYRAKRSAELLELEAEAVQYEKALATTQGGLSVEEQARRANGTVVEFEELKTLLSDGNVSPLDLLRLKNAFRRIGPLRSAIVKGELAAVKSELTGYENALADAEVDLVNDARDDRYDREALLDKLPDKRHHEAELILDAMEVRHHALLKRSRDVLGKLAQRSENTQSEINRRIKTLDEEYTFIRTHIFWVRDAEPVGPATLAHARNEAFRVIRALAKLAIEPADRTLWGKVSPDFILAVVGLIVLPWPLRLGQKALDRLRLAAPDPTMTPETAPSAVVG